jgi:hypothetical protein
MKILSFDIGIKNLAYCILNYNKETSDISIIDWNIINILQDECDKFKDICDIDCKFKSKYYCYRNGEPVVLCEKHRKKELIEYEKLQEVVWEKNIHKDKCSIPNCNSISKWNCEEHFYCTKHKNEIKKNIKECYNIKKIKVIKVNQIATKDLFERTIKLFDRDYRHFLSVDYVVLESQPPFGTIKLKTVLNNLRSYFLLRGKFNDTSNIKDIHTISANLKLKYDEEKTTNEVKNKTGKDRYNKNKFLAIEYTLKILREREESDFINHFNSFKKKDDLADAFLQGKIFIENNMRLLNKH